MVDSAVKSRYRLDVCTVSPVRVGGYLPLLPYFESGPYGEATMYSINSSTLSNTAPLLIPPDHQLDLAS